MKKNLKYILSILVLAILAFSAASTMLAHAIPWTSGQLLTGNTITIAGSSTVGPVAQEESTPSINSNYTDFQDYWNNLVTNNWNSGTSTSSWCTLASGYTQAQAYNQLKITAVSLATLGSGTAIPALAGTTGTADIGEMSRPPSTAEWQTTGMGSLQQWAIGVDSVAIVVSPDMTWFPTNLNTLQVAQLFADNAYPGHTGANEGLTGGAPSNDLTNTTYNPLYVTWGDFLAAYYGGAGNIPTTGAMAPPAAALTEPILRAVRDATSGTYDCFNNYFAKPNGYNFEHTSQVNTTDTPNNVAITTVDGSLEMPTYTYDQENINVFNSVSTGNLAGSSDYIGFLSLGYLVSYGANGANLRGLNVAYNMQSLPYNGTTGAKQPTVSPLISYYGPSSGATFGATSNSAYQISSTNSNPYQVYAWGPFVQPTNPNVIYAYSGVQGKAATGAYEAWRWLWEVTPSTIPANGPLLATGVWISYMMKSNTTDNGASQFVSDQNYIPLSRADMAGATPIDSNLSPYGSVQGLTTSQTQTIPNGKVDGNDFLYFVDAYIHYYSSNIYNPYADILSSGKIDGSSFLGFVAAYIYYYTNYNPTH